jgi:sugar O-acyltransferase (sialic acid O-acetyltransferase NeuD family)
MSGLVIFGASNIASDLFDCALALGLPIAQVVMHLPEPEDARSVPLARRLAALAAHGMHPALVELDAFRPQPGQQYLLGPTTPSRAALARLLEERFGLGFCTLVHPRAYVSPLASLAPGVFVGANSTVGPGAQLAEHVFVNRGVTIGHDTRIAPFARIQPGANVGGLSEIGEGVTVGIGATLIERLVIGAGAFVGAGAVVTADVAPRVLVVGVPAKFKKALDA